MERKDGKLLIFEPVCRHLTAFAIENEGIGAIPILDNVKPFVDFPT